MVSNRGKEHIKKSVRNTKQTDAKRNTSKPFEPIKNRDRSTCYPGNNIWDNEEWILIRGQRNRNTRGRGRKSGNSETVRGGCNRGRGQQREDSNRRTTSRGKTLSILFFGRGWNKQSLNQDASAK